MATFVFIPRDARARVHLSHGDWLESTSAREYQSVRHQHPTERRSTVSCWPITTACPKKPVPRAPGIATRSPAIEARPANTIGAKPARDAARPRAPIPRQRIQARHRHYTVAAETVTASAVAKWQSISSYSMSIAAAVEYLDLGAFRVRRGLRRRGRFGVAAIVCAQCFTWRFDCDGVRF